MPLVILLVMCCGIELILRYAKPELKYLYHSPIDKHTGVGYTGGYEFRYNRWQMREREFTPEKPPGQLRVLCLGDSITFGYGLPSHQAWPKVLEKLFRDNRWPPLDYFFINAAGPAADTNGQADFYSKTCRKFGHKLVIVGFCLNDVTKRGFVEKATPGAMISRILKWRYEMRKSYLVAALDDSLTEGLKKHLLPLLGKDWVSMYPYCTNSLISTPQSEEAWNDTLASLKTLKTMTAEDNASLMVVVFPYQFLISADRRDNPFLVDKRRFNSDPFSRLGNFCRQEGIIFLNLFEPYAALRKSILNGTIAYDTLFLDWCHPNAKGQEIAATSIYNVILSNKPILGF